MPAQLEEAQTKLSNVEHQLETAKAEVDKPFPQEAESERKLADRPAERTSLKGKLSEMKARVSRTPAGRDAVDRAKGKEEVI